MSSACAIYAIDSFRVLYIYGVFCDGRRRASWEAWEGVCLLHPQGCEEGVVAAIYTLWGLADISLARHNIDRERKVVVCLREAVGQRREVKADAAVSWSRPCFSP